jgi:hypothetical protein
MNAGRTLRANVASVGFTQSIPSVLELRKDWALRLLAGYPVVAVPAVSHAVPPER